VFYVFKWLSALFRHEKSHLFKARNNEVEVVCTIPKGEIELVALIKKALEVNLANLEFA